MGFLKKFMKGGFGLGGLLGGMMGGGKNPADAARGHLEGIPGYGREAYNPFIEQGKQAYARLGPEYEKMLMNPKEYYDKDVAGYQTSGHYNAIAPRLEQSMANAAAAGGYVGTGDDQTRRAELIQQLMSSDLGDYIGNIQNYRSGGMQGYENTVGRGFQGAGQLADYLGNAAGNRANLEYSGRSQQLQQKHDTMMQLLKIGSMLAGAHFGGAPGAAAAGMAGGGSPQYGGKPLGAIQTRPFYSPDIAYGRGGYRAGGRR